MPLSLKIIATEEWKEEKQPFIFYENLACTVSKETEPVRDRQKGGRDEKNI